MWQTLLAVLPSLIGLMGNGMRPDSSQPQTTAGATNEDMAAILSNQRRRMEAQDPLYEAVTRMAMGMLPTQYQLPSGTMAGYPRRPGTAGPAPSGNVDRTRPGDEARAYFAKSEDQWFGPDELRRRENPEWSQR